MRSRQTLPTAWLILDGRNRAADLKLVRHLPVGTGLLLLGRLSARDKRHLLLTAKRRRLMLVVEAAGQAARVHNTWEIARARLAGTPLLLLSPIFPTRSHPGEGSLPRMRAAALARLAGRPLLALGGMDAARFDRIAAWGFDGWAGIDAWGARGA